jgi:hypothetical protein
MQEIIYRLNLVKEFSRAVKQMSCWIDIRQPQYLTNTEKALVEKDSELQSAIQ